MMDGVGVVMLRVNIIGGDPEMTTLEVLVCEIEG